MLFWVFSRRGGLRKRKTKAADVMVSAEVLNEFDGEAGAAFEFDRLGEVDFKVAVFVELFTFLMNGPTGSEVTIDGVGRGEAFLFRVGFCGGEPDFHWLGFAFKRRSEDFDFIENEVAVFGSSGAFTAESQRVETERGNVALS